MKKLMIVGLACVLFSPLSVAVSVRPPRREKLTLKEFMVMDATTQKCRRRSTRGGRRRPRGLKAAPPEADTFCSIRVADGIIVVASSSRSRALYVDTDNDGDMTDESALVGRSSSNWLRFGPVSIMMDKEGKQATEVLLWREPGNAKAFSATPPGIAEGQLRVGDFSVRFWVADANMNGRYGDCWQSARATGDLIGLDVNRDGHIDLAGEVVPLTKSVKIGGSFFELAVADDGSSICLNPATPVTGTMKLALPGAKAVLVSKDAHVSVGDGQDEYQVPVGTYYVSMFNVVAKSGSLNAGTLKGKKWPKGHPGFEVRAGQTTELKLGLPLIARPRVKRRGSTVSLELRIFGAAGEEYSTSRGSGLGIAFPTVRILDKGGKVVNSGTFSFGCGGTCGYSWRVPRGPNGKFRVEIGPKFGPFTLTNEETWH